MFVFCDVCVQLAHLFSPDVDRERVSISVSGLSQRFRSGCGTSFCSGFVQASAQIESVTEDVLAIANVLNGDPSVERIVHYCYHVAADGRVEPCCLSEQDARLKVQDALKRLLTLISRTIGDRVTTKAWLETPRAATKVAFAVLFFGFMKKLINHAWSKRVRGDDQAEQAEEEYQVKQAKRKRCVGRHSRHNCGQVDWGIGIGAWNSEF